MMKKNEKGLPASRQAVVLLSGGLDSATTLYIAKKAGFKCFCLIFDYGQRHGKEMESAKAIAKKANCKYQIIKLSLPWKGSALLDKKIGLPVGVKVSLPVPARPCPSLPVRQAGGRRAAGGRQAGKCQSVKEIPTTYVPGRNIIFLSFALSYAEVINAEAIFIGAHIEDQPGYPDCRPEFYRAFKKVIDIGTKAGMEKRKIEVKTPLIYKTKSQIIKLGMRLGVPFDLTWSCYRGGRIPCDKCDSCYFRAKGFKEAGLPDPLLGTSLLPSPQTVASPPSILAEIGRVSLKRR